MSLTINVDSDGVVYNLTKQTAQAMNKKYPDRAGEFTPPTRWNTGEEWGLSWSVISDYWAKVTAWADGEPIPDAIEALDELVRADHKVRIVTHKQALANPRNAMVGMLMFYDRFELLRDVDIVFTRHDKTEYTADVVIDDKPTLAWAQPGALNILFAQPWNKNHDEPPTGAWVVRVDGWSNVLALVDDLASRQEATYVI